MAVISGLDMAVNGQNTARAFTMEISDELNEYITSGLSSGVGNKCGVDDWKGAGMFLDAQPWVFPGDTFTFTGSLDGTYGFTGSAYCEAIEIVWDIEKNEYIASSVQFSRNGTLTIGLAAATDTVRAYPACTESLPLLLGTVEQSDVTYARLKMSCRGLPYVTSATSGGRLRKRGSFRAELEYHRYYQNPGSLPTRGLEYRLQMYDTATTYWDLSWMKVRKIMPYVNPESNRPVNAKVIMDMTGTNATDMGSCINPSLATKWPFS